MIVVGVDPGARDTGLVIVAGRDLLHSTTLSRPKTEELLHVEPGYLLDVVAAVTNIVRSHGDVDLLAVEGVKRPSWRVKGRAKPLDPSAIMATAIVFGSVMGRDYGVPVVVVPPDGNGTRPMSSYPDALHPTRGRGKGLDALRHERSAYDVATLGPQYRALVRTRGTVYGC